MEYLPLGSIQGYRDSQPQNRMEMPDIKQVMKQSLEALKYLHRERIVHRDIKEDNILIKEHRLETLQIVLADFGIAAFQKTPGTIIGCLGYIAPEIFSVEKYGGLYSDKVDLWALGMTMIKLDWVIFTGFPARQTLGDSSHYFRAVRQAVNNAKNNYSADRTYWQLLIRLLEEDADRRRSAEECLRLPWFA